MVIDPETTVSVTAAMLLDEVCGDAALNADDSMAVVDANCSVEAAGEVS